MTPVAANVQSMKPGISPEEWKAQRRSRCGVPAGGDARLGRASVRAPLRPRSRRSQSFSDAPGAPAVRGGHRLEPPQARRELQPRDARATRSRTSSRFPFHKGIYDAFPAGALRGAPAYQGGDRGGDAGPGPDPRQPIRDVARPDRLPQLRGPGFDARGRRAAGEELRQGPGRAAEGPRLRAVGTLDPRSLHAGVPDRSAPARCRSPRWPAPSSPTFRRKRCSTSPSEQAQHHHRRRMRRSTR